ncbi:hypothetical protein QE449_001295 [Rhodococcus sp. SORGH_AS303]|nr:hypothetical protein [Rhodococcus sp. SORGH_AS_0303]
MQERDGNAEPAFEVRRHHRAERRELGEQQCFLAVAEDRVENVVHECELAGAVLATTQHRRPVVEEVRRVIAHLLEPGQRAEHRALARHALTLGDLPHHLVDHCLVQARLLGGEVRAHGHLELVGQIRDDRLVGLHPPQNER